MRHKQGKLIVVDGIDQSGKKTQTKFLAGKVRRLGYACSIWSFPDYRTPLGRQLRNYLAGKQRFDFRTVHLLYAANKWERASFIAREIARGRILIVNRYTPSNLAYGIAHGLPMNWLQSLETGLPQPNLVIVLDVSPKASFERKTRLRDVHEDDLPYLNRVRKAYLRLAKKYRWAVIDGQRDPRTVQLKVWKQVSPLLA